MGKIDYREYMKQQYEADEVSGGGNVFWRPRVVKDASDDGNLIRIITPPYMKPDENAGVVIRPWVEYWEWRVPMPGGKFKTTPCAGDFHLPDPIMDYVDTLNAGSAADKALAAKYSRRRQYLILILDLEAGDGKVRVWNCGKSVIDQIKKFSLHRSYNLLWDNERGHDLTVRATGEGFNREYDCIPDPAPTPIDNLDAVMAAAMKIDLAKFVNVETPETLEDILDNEYDKDTAAKRREARDSVHGRPFPLFVTGDEEPEPEAEKPSRRARKAQAEEPEPEAPKAEEPKRARRRKVEPEPEPEPEPEVSTSLFDNLLIDDTVSYLDEDGNETTGEIIEISRAKGDEFVVVKDAQGEEWELQPDEIIARAKPKPAEQEEPAPTRRRRRTAAPAAEAKAETEADMLDNEAEEPKAEGTQQSVVDRVAALTRRARGEA